MNPLAPAPESQPESAPESSLESAPGPTLEPESESESEPAPGPAADLTSVLLAELAAQEAPVSAARVCKRLGVRMSSLLRCLAYLGDDVVGGAPGPGLVCVRQSGERTMLSLSEKGRAACKTTR